MKPSGRKKRKLVFWLLLGAVLLTCCCCAAGAVVLVRGGSGPGAGIYGEVCAGFASTPRFQMGVAWYLPISSYYPPLMASPSVVCVEVPWSLTAVWPSMAGQVVLPP